MPKCNLAGVRNREGCRGQTNCQALRRGGGSSITSRGRLTWAFERALSAGIAASELLRVRVLAATLFLLVSEQLTFLFASDLVEQFTPEPVPRSAGCGGFGYPTGVHRPTEGTNR